GGSAREGSETMRDGLGLDIPAPEIERAVVDAMVDRYAREGAPVIDDAVGAVRRIAADRPVGLASSSHPAVIEAALETTGLRDVFHAVVSSDQVAHGKPEPDVFLEAARGLGVERASAVVVEASFNGLRAGRAAGMTTVLIPNASVPPAPGAEAYADLTLDRLADLDPDAIQPRRPNPSSDGAPAPPDE